MDATDGVAPVVIPEDTSEVGAHVEQMEETLKKNSMFCDRREQKIEKITMVVMMFK